ncbi:unnamed protein product [Prorocentrum cordatum]|uniref:Uncharacterized protein n=1 Tax=Prorocentrum cordatum TaxID=2364126 RepID=A0ABN9TUB6_9DINO|nr:unnamed protein product [Polarella glacialis]
MLGDHLQLRGAAFARNGNGLIAATLPGKSSDTVTSARHLGTSPGAPTRPRGRPRRPSYFQGALVNLQSARGVFVSVFGSASWTFFFSVSSSPSRSTLKVLQDGPKPFRSRFGSSGSAGAPGFARSGLFRGAPRPMAPRLMGEISAWYPEEGRGYIQRTVRERTATQAEVFEVYAFLGTEVSGDPAEFATFSPVAFRFGGRNSRGQWLARRVQPLKEPGVDAAPGCGAQDLAGGAGPAGGEPEDFAEAEAKRQAKAKRKAKQESAADALPDGGAAPEGVLAPSKRRRKSDAAKVKAEVKVEVKTEVKTERLSPERAQRRSRVKAEPTD